VCEASPEAPRDERLGRDKQQPWPSAKLVVMPVTRHVPEDLASRLEAEASRRGITVDELAAEALADRFPRAATDPSRDTLEAFIGSGASGRREPFDIHQARAELAGRKLAEGTEPGRGRPRRYGRPAP
jgi:hypothetical protein